MEEKKCPCESGQTYENCCEKYHTNKAFAENAELLMRSRFSAYALSLANYIIATTHPANSLYNNDLKLWKEEITEFTKKGKINKLKIINVQEKKDFASVTFSFNLLKGERNYLLMENSLFEKIQDKWLYKAGKHGPIRSLLRPDFNVLPVAYYIDPFFKQKTREIDKKDLGPSFFNLVSDMEKTLWIYNKEGLSAPQVFNLLKFFIIKIKEEIKLFINPKIYKLTNETQLNKESCLSIPGIEADVKRPKEIEVEYMNFKGEMTRSKFFNKDSCKIMHHNDHLNGIFFINRLDAIEKKRIKKDLQLLNKRLKSLKC